MRIESVDFFYLSMPEILDIGDGSQDALLVRVRAGDYTGWGECEAAPLPSIASFVCPPSHSICKPVGDSVLGQRLDSIDDIRRIGDLVRANSLDLLQSAHTLSGIDIALWDLLGKKFETPVYKLLGYRQAHAKQPYASQLFGDTPQETLEKARHSVALGYRAAKFEWGPFGRGSVEADRDQLMAAREGMGDDAVIMIDAGTIWVDDVEQAQRRVPALDECRVLWLEEPFVSGALHAYREFARTSGTTRLAAGEGCHNYYMARQMIDSGGLGFIQIDTGRIGGITVAKQIADYTVGQPITYVNHTFTSHLALSASLQPFAGFAEDIICEYPAEPKSLAVEMTVEHIERDANGEVRAPEAPGLGMTIDTTALRKYLVETEIRVGGKVLYSTPEL